MAKKPRTILDFIMASAKVEAEEDTLTLEEWTRIRRNSDPEEIAAAIERMEAAGGYDCLE